MFTPIVRCPCSPHADTVFYTCFVFDSCTAQWWTNSSFLTHYLFATVIFTARKCRSKSYRYRIDVVHIIMTAMIYPPKWTIFLGISAYCICMRKTLLYLSMMLSLLSQPVNVKILALALALYSKPRLHVHHQITRFGSHIYKTNKDVDLGL